MINKRFRIKKDEKLNTPRKFVGAEGIVEKELRPNRFGRKFKFKCDGFIFNAYLTELEPVHESNKAKYKKGKLQSKITL